jgi:hypothetical protein
VLSVARCQVTVIVELVVLIALGLRGGDGGSVSAAAARAATTAVGDETEVELPYAFDAVTATRTVDPTSAVVRACEPSVSRLGLQASPLALHRRHV